MREIDWFTYAAIFHAVLLGSWNDGEIITWVIWLVFGLASSKAA